MSYAIGVDVSKATLEVLAEPSAPSRTFANAKAGIVELIAWLVPMKPSRVVFEASGGYEKDLLFALVAAGLPASRVNAQQVRHFAKALGQRAKTDPIDAAVLQRFGELFQPALCVVPSAAQARLRDLTQRRVQLVNLRVAEINRSYQASTPLAASHRRVRAALTREITRIERDIQRCLAAADADAIKATVDLLAQTPGIATVISATVAANLPELGHCSRRAICALVGVAPIADDSGKHHGQRHIAGGRAVVRTALYQAVLSGLRHNPPLKALYARLKAKGKPSKVAMTACMRHLLCMLNAMVRDQQPWRHAPLPA